MAVGGLPLTNTHNALTCSCLCDRHHPQCVGGGDGRPWTWLCGRRGCCRGATTDGSAHTRGRQDQPNDKDQWAWVSADTHRLNNRGRRVGPSYRKAAVITATTHLTAEQILGLIEGCSGELLLRVSEAVPHLVASKRLQLIRCKVPSFFCGCGKQHPT